ncbi:MAG TPA: hypothetical protein VI076_16895 [Actinopolymorphaceae bacterium]
MTGGLCALVSPLLALAPGGIRPAEAGPSGGGIGWQYHEESRSYYQTPDSTPGNPGPARRPTRYVDWGPGDLEQYECPDEYDGSPFECDGPDGTFCNSLPGANGLPVAPRVVFEREFEDPVTQEGNPPWIPIDPPPQDPEHATPYCQELPEDHVVTQEEIHEVNYSIFQDLTGLEVDVRPDGRTLVDLETILSTPYPENVNQIPEVEVLDADRQPRPYIRLAGEVDGHVEPFDYTIEAYADITWTIEGGDPPTATGRGRPYDGTLPSSAPGHYVTAEFHDTGVKTITLGAVWEGTVTVDAPGQTPQDMDPVEIDPVSDTVEVVEKRSVLGDD